MVYTERRKVAMLTLLIAFVVGVSMVFMSATPVHAAKKVGKAKVTYSMSKKGNVKTKVKIKWSAKNATRYDVKRTAYYKSGKKETDKVFSGTKKTSTTVYFYKSKSKDKVVKVAFDVYGFNSRYTGKHGGVILNNPY